MTVTDQAHQALATLVRQIQAFDRHGAGDPNGKVDAPRGATYKREDTGTVYRKTTVLGTLTGWVTP